MTISRYSFGQILIRGRTYTSDVIVFPDRVQDMWRRKEGHQLRVEDVAAVVAAGPEAVVIGTGSLGAMKVPDETKAYLRARGIEVHIARTGRAAKIYNDIQARRRTVACLHLTC